MIQGLYFNTLNQTFDDYFNKFIENKSLLKDFSPKTLQKFMQNFMEFSYFKEIRNLITYDNFMDFVNTYFDDIFIHKEENTFDNFSLKQKEEYLYLKLFFFENCLIAFKMSESQKYSEIIHHFFNLLIQKFESNFILNNILIFNYYLKTLIHITHISLNTNLEISTLFESITTFVTNENKRNLIVILFFNKLLGIYKIHGKFELSNKQVQFVKNSLNENLENFINFLIDIKKLLHLIIPNSSSSQLVQIQNNLQLIFKKLFIKIKNEKFGNIHNKMIEIFITKLIKSNFKESEYENFVFLFLQIFEDIFDDKSHDSNRIKILLKILQSNQPILHKLSVNILDKIKNENLINKEFIEKFISVFDVLDGYNSHLFKSLWKDFESVMIFCENNKENFLIKNKLFVKSEKSVSLKEIFSNPFNYFLIISNKIKNHDNARIQKFFIKSFANLSHNMKFNNKNFEYFLYSTLLKMLNNPLFYPENESISYHAKVGLIAEKLYSDWFERCVDLENNLVTFLKGIVRHITNRRIFNYLINSIHNLFTQTSRKYNFNNEISENILKILDSNQKYLSLYQKQKFWESINLLMINSNILDIKNNQFLETGNLIKIFYSFLKFILYKDNYNYISIENIDLLDNQKFSNFMEFFTFFKNYLSQYFSVENISNDFTDFNGIIKCFIENNKNIINFEKIDNDIVLSLFWFLLINNENKNLKEIFKNFSTQISKLIAPYITENYKLFILQNFRIIINILEFYSNNNLVDYFYIESFIDSYDNILEYYFNNLKHIKISNEKEIQISEELDFFILNSSLIEYTFQKFYYLYLKEGPKRNSYQLFLKLINQFISIKDTFDLFSNEAEDFLVIDENKLKLLHFAASSLKLLTIKVNMINHLLKDKFIEVFTRKENYLNLILSINKISKSILFIEQFIIRDKSFWLKENKMKNIFNNLTFNLIKIKTLSLMIIQQFNKEDESIKESVNIIFHTDHSAYSYILLEYLEKSNDEDIYYILKLISLYIYFYAKEIKEDFIKSYIKLGLSTLTEIRENLNYINVSTFLGSFMNNNLISNHSSTIEMISSFIHKLSDLNEKRTWLLLKIGSEYLLNLIKENPKLILNFRYNIIELAESKETRGEDSFMLQTNPRYLYSPFNVSSISILKNDILNEDVYKYGLYIRLRISIFFDDYLKNCNVDSLDNNSILNLIKLLLSEIDINTTQKTEMQFTSKHRRKLRLSQFILILSQIFQKLNFDENIDIVYEIENLAIKIFEKINLTSVRFYLDFFFLQLAKYKLSFFNYLIAAISDPNTKTHIVTSSLIILSVLILEHKKEEYSCITPVLIQKIYETITALCTSNICNIRGFAQYFVYRLRNKLNEDNINLDLLEKINVSEFFYNYLISNTNIKRFFSKFSENYERFTKLVKEFSVENILKNNFDEVNCEIMPMDFVKEFKRMATKMIELDNEDLSKPYISWRIEIEQTEVDKLLENIEVNSDFQQKYRPLDEEDYNKKNKKRLDVVVMASLIDKAPNLGGLARTCEVFNMGAMTINSDSYLNDNSFLTAAASAEKWLPILNLPIVDIERFIRGYKKLGYKIIGLEQTHNSITLKEFKFEEKTLIVLGNEKEGIPQNLINLIDYCVIIPQFGEIRSLNVHVSAALMLWELVSTIKK